MKHSPKKRIFLIKKYSCQIIFTLISLSILFEYNFNYEASFYCIDEAIWINNLLLKNQIEEIQVYLAYRN